MASRLKGRAPKDVKPGRIKGILSGPPKTGKTWTALAFPAPFYVDVEGGADLRHYQKRLEEAGGWYFGPEDGSTDFDAIIEQVDILATERHKYRTLVIDSQSKLFWSLAAREQERLGDKDAFGAYKKVALAKTRKLFNHIERLDMNVWFIAHEIAVWEGSGNERRETGKGPDVGWDKLPYELDLILQTKQLGKDIREAVVWGSRLQGFPTGDRFYLQKDGVDVSYANFTERYAKDAIEAEVKPIVLVKAETIVELKRLLEIVRVPEEDVQKFLAKSNADSMEELTEEQADTLVKFLDKKLAAPAKKDA